MAEFVSGGLSAVSAFFGVDDGMKHDEPQHHASSSRHHPHASRGRHGVGSYQRQVKSSETSDTAISRVLKVGKRKRQDNSDDDEIALHEEVEPEEEEGRTALASEKPTTASTETIKVEKQKKKKKVGKKERQAQASDNEVKHKETGSDDDANAIEAGNNANDTNEEQTKKSKHKRRKKRSRQKNIYKDKRLAQHKPSHLILGRTEFHGRPLTAETRTKLNLAPSRSSRYQQDNDDGESADNVEAKAQSSTSEGAKLAVDDLLQDEGAVQGNDDSVFKVHTRKKKKRKKSKYKNLQ